MSVPRGNCTTMIGLSSTHVSQFGICTIKHLPRQPESIRHLRVFQLDVNGIFNGPLQLRVKDSLQFLVTQAAWRSRYVRRVRMSCLLFLNKHPTGVLVQTNVCQRPSSITADSSSLCQFGVGCAKTSIVSDATIANPHLERHLHALYQLIPSLRNRLLMKLLEDCPSNPNGLLRSLMKINTLR